MKSKPARQSSTPSSTVGTSRPSDFLMFLAGRNGAIDRSPEIWMIELTGYAERNGEIKVTDPKDVDALNRGYLFSVVHAGRGFNLTEQGRSIVRRREFLGHCSGAVTVMSDLQSDATTASGMVFHPLYDLPSFLCGAHHWQH